MRNQVRHTGESGGPKFAACNVEKSQTSVKLTDTPRRMRLTFRKGRTPCRRNMISPTPDTPQFIESPDPESTGVVQSGMAPTANSPAPARSTTRPPADPPSPPPSQSKSSLLSSGLMMIVGAAIAAGGYGLARVFAPPGSPGEVNANKPAPPPADMVKSEDFKALSKRVDDLKAEADETKKGMGSQPNLAPGGSRSPAKRSTR